MQHSTVRRCFSLLCLAVFALLLSDWARAQGSYIFSMESAPYTELEGATPLVKLPEMPMTDTVFSVDLKGEGFRLYNEEFRVDEEAPLIIYGGGFIRFNKADALDAVVIDGFLSVLDYLDEESAVSYLMDHNEEEGILKVEWKRMALIDSPDVADDHVSFQVWVYQNSGVVELRYGPRQLEADSGVSLGGGPFIGIFKFADVPVFRIFEKNWLIGNPFAPDYDTTRTGFSILEGCPREGTVFRFVPRISSSVGDPDNSGARGGMGEYRIFPNPTSGAMTLQAATPLESAARVRVIDVLGRIISETQMEPSSSTLDLNLPALGLYYCEVSGNGVAQVYSVVRQ